MEQHSEGSQRESSIASGFGQLTLVEHALCPLDSKTSLQENLLFETQYSYSDKDGNREKANARVLSPFGLSPKDEFYLWGLLSLTFAGPESEIEFWATRHYCLRELGAIDQHSGRGGVQYEQFSKAIERLAAVTYQSDAFYDPIRAEHRKVSFGFLSYSLPIDPNSSRAWRFVWDPLFFEFCKAAGGTLRFDFETYRKLDAASRRLFLLLRKVFWRRKLSPVFDLRELAVNSLGFSDSQPLKALKRKVKTASEKLLEAGIIEPLHGADSVEGFFNRRAKGKYSVQFARGEHFNGERRISPRIDASKSPLAEPLISIGFDSQAITRILSDFKTPLVREWTDITLAARERFGESFFKKSPQAYLMDNLKNAREGTRMPPDWWYDVRKEEERRQFERKPQKKQPETGAFREFLLGDGRGAFESVVAQMFEQFRAAGQDVGTAKMNATRSAKEHLRKRFQMQQQESSGSDRPIH